MLSMGRISQALPLIRTGCCSWPPAGGPVLRLAILFSFRCPNRTQFPLHLRSGKVLYAAPAQRPASSVPRSPWGENPARRRARGVTRSAPNFLGVGTTLDEDAFRQHIRKSLTLARGCKMEITQRDVYTINNDIAKARRYVQIIKQEIVNLW